MGCWNKTCGATNFFITAGTPVVFFALEQSYTGSSFCYSGAMWQPWLMPMYGEYDDYGRAEEVTGGGVSVVIDGLKQCLVEMEGGENKSHDIAVKREGFDDERFFEAVHERRLFVSNFMGERREVQCMMIHKSAWDYILQHQPLEYYVSGEGTKTFKVADIISAIPGLVDEMVTTFNGEPQDGWRPHFCSRRFFFDTRKTSSPEIVRLSRWLDQTTYTHLHVNHILDDMIETGDKAAAIELLTEYAKAQTFDEFMSSTRKMWSPQTGEGSQQDDIEPYRLLIGATNALIDERIAKIKEWGWEDEEEDDK